MYYSIFINPKFSNAQCAQAHFSSTLQTVSISTYSDATIFIYI